MFAPRCEGDCPQRSVLDGWLIRVEHSVPIEEIERAALATAELLEPERRNATCLPPWREEVVKIPNGLVQTDSQNIGQLSRDTEPVIMAGLECAIHDLVRVREKRSATQRPGP